MVLQFSGFTLDLQSCSMALLLWSYSCALVSPPSPPQPSKSLAQLWSTVPPALPALPNSLASAVRPQSPGLPEPLWSSETWPKPRTFRLHFGPLCPIPPWSNKHTAPLRLFILLAPQQSIILPVSLWPFDFLAPPWTSGPLLLYRVPPSL